MILIQTFSDEKEYWKMSIVLFRLDSEWFVAFSMTWMNSDVRLADERMKGVRFVDVNLETRNPFKKLRCLRFIGFPACRDNDHPLA